ncbi:hypothetical protein ACOTBX_24770 [Achromobacter xylosoxidans]
MRTPDSRTAGEILRDLLEDMIDRLGLPRHLLCSHDPEDTRTPPAPGAIQIGPLDVP